MWLESGAGCPPSESSRDDTDGVELVDRDTLNKVMRHCREVTVGYFGPFCWKQPCEDQNHAQGRGCNHFPCSFIFPGNKTGLLIPL